MEGLERGDDLLHETEVDGGAASGVDVGFGLADAEFDGFVCTEMKEGAVWVVCDELGEPAFDEGEGAGLARGEDGSMWGFSEGIVLLVLEDVAQVPEGFLLRDDDDVVARGKGGKVAGFRRR